MFGIYGRKEIKNLKEQIKALQDRFDSLSDKFNKKQSEVSVLCRISKDIIAILDLDILLKKSMDILMEVMNVENVAIALEESGNFLIKGFKNLEKDNALKIKITFENELINVLKETKRPFTMQELKKRVPSLAFSDIMLINPTVLSPLFFENQISGFISLSNFKAKEAFSDDELELLSALSSQIAVAISNAQLYKKLEVANKELSAKILESADLHRISQAVTSVLDIEKLKKLAIEMFMELTKTGKAILFLTDDEETRLVPAEWAGIDEVVFEDLGFETEDKFIKLLINQRKPYLAIPTQIKESLLKCQCAPAMSEVLANLGLILYVPFISKDRIVALIVSGNKASGEEFTYVELELLRTFSSQVGISIDNAKLYELAVRDGLTRAFIHRFFQNRLDYEMRVGIRYMGKRVISLAMVDIDNFKKINDAHGHLVGDQILRDIAKIIMRNIRITDWVARYGGEEFAIILPEMDLEEAGIICENIRKKIEAFRFSYANLSLKVTVSFGVASFPDFAKTKEDLIDKADKALYRSKLEGRNKVTLCNVLN